jgi:hypothetical protein
MPAATVEVYSSLIFPSSLFMWIGAGTNPVLFLSRWIKRLEVF